MTAINTPDEIKLALAVLSEPTPPDAIRYRKALKKNGDPVVDPATGEIKMLAYVTARYVQDRLDSIGPENWQSSYRVGDGGAICTIRVRLGGEWIEKADGGDPSDIEGFKGQLSDAFKRAGVMWGIARDLYEERDAPRTPQASVPARTPAPGSNVSDATPGRTDADGTPIDVCPVHNLPWTHKTGVSKKTNKPYDFWTCPAPYPPGCKERPPEGWTAIEALAPFDDVPF